MENLKSTNKQLFDFIFKKMGTNIGFFR